MAEEIKFEKAMERLEKIVEDLENGDVALEEALKKYEEGVKLSRACQKKLTESEKKIEVLTRALDGSLKEVPYDPDTASEISTKVSSKRGKATRSKKTSEDDDILI